MPTTARRGSGAVGDGPRIGVLGCTDLDDLGAVVATRVVEAELERRLPGATLRCLAPLGRRRPRPRDGGRPGEPLLDDLPFEGGADWDRFSAALRDLDLLVVAGPHCLDDPGTFERLYTGDADLGIGREGAAAVGRLAPLAVRVALALAGVVPVAWHALVVPAVPTGGNDPGPLLVATRSLARLSVTGPGSAARLRDAGVQRPVTVVPDDALLLPRLVPASVLRRRADHLAVEGGLDGAQGWVVVDTDVLDGPFAPGLAALAGNRWIVAVDLGAGPRQRGVALHGDRPPGSAGASEALLGGWPGSVSADAGRMGTVAGGLRIVRLGPESPLEDVAAAVSTAAAVVTTSPTLAAAGRAFGVPVVGVATQGGDVCPGPEFPAQVVVADAMTFASILKPLVAPDRLRHGGRSSGAGGERLGRQAVLSAPRSSSLPGRAVDLPLGPDPRLVATLDAEFDALAAVASSSHVGASPSARPSTARRPLPSPTPSGFPGVHEDRSGAAEATPQGHAARGSLPGPSARAGADPSGVVVAGRLTEVEEAWRARGRRLVAERMALHAEIALLEEELRHRQMEAAEAVARWQREAAFWRATAERALSSRTWRWTEPARRLFRLLRRGSA